MSLDSFFSYGPDECGVAQMSVAVGLVSNNKDPEKLGRVKVTFPGRSIPDPSHWARVATMMAGLSRGSYFLPEVGDEVLVAFDHGDLNYPYVIGALWNGRDLPPEKNSNGLNDIRKITSRSGHELIFDDSSLGGGIELHTNSGHTVKLDETIGAESIEISDSNEQNKIIIDSVKGEIRITSLMLLKLKANRIDIEAATDMKLHAGASLEIGAAIVMIN